VWISKDYRGKSVDNRGGDETEGVWLVMKDLYAHTRPPITHTLYKTNPRAEQGFYTLSTGQGSSYYDYLYIHTTSYANNLSTLKKIRG
jgi:hypothetical protein